MIRLLTGWLSLIFLLAPGVTVGKEPTKKRELQGLVYFVQPSGSRKPAVNVEVLLMGVGPNTTTPHGDFTFTVPEDFKAGRKIKLSVKTTGDLDGWAVSPRTSLEQLFLPDDLEMERNYIEIELIPVDSPIFMNYEAMLALIRASGEQPRQPQAKPGEGFLEKDTGKPNLEYAAKHKLSPTEISRKQEEVTKRIAQTGDAREKGYAARSRQEFGAAADFFQSSADARRRKYEDTKKTMKEIEREMIRMIKGARGNMI